MRNSTTLTWRTPRLSREIDEGPSAGIGLIFLSRSTFLTESFPDEITTHILNHSLLDVDLGQLTIRSDPGDRAYEEVLSK